jgi:hypothetical protein
VIIPTTLDRDSLVEWTGAGELKVSGRDRWAEPLDEMIQSVLAADLRKQRPRLVLLPGDPVPPGGARSIVVNVRHFAAENASRVVFLADWSVMTGKPPLPAFTRSEAIEVPLKSDQSSAVVSAMSQALAILSDRIANTVLGEKTEAARAEEIH